MDAWRGRGCRGDYGREGRGSGGRSSLAPADLVEPVEVEFFAVLDVQELPEDVPYLDDVVDVQSWGERCGENEFAVGRVNRSISWSMSKMSIFSRD